MSNLGGSGSTLNELDVLADDAALLELALDEEYNRVRRDFPDDLPPLRGAS